MSEERECDLVSLETYSKTLTRKEKEQKTFKKSFYQMGERALPKTNKRGKSQQHFRKVFCQNGTRNSNLLKLKKKAPSLGVSLPKLIFTITN